jgi:diadenosine tetraphosphate (Ap4A) HIT family hydrolase
VDGCSTCEENARQAAGQLEGAVASLATGSVRLQRRQRYRGASFFVAHDCVREVYDLEPDRRSLHLLELAEVAAAIDAAFLPVKMNIESLGNGVPAPSLVADATARR